MSKSYYMEKDVYKFIKLGYDKTRIAKAVLSNDDTLDKIMVEEAVDRLCDDYPDYELIQFFMNSKIIVDKDGEDEMIYMFHPITKEVRTLNKIKLSNMISSKLDWGSKRHTCNFIYDPHKAYKLKKIDGEWRYNLYKPPGWEEEYFNSSGRIAIPKVELPEKYDQFFRHLVNEDKESYNYLLDWMTLAIRGRNRCYLTTIGDQGIGKGRLGDIMMVIFGNTNYAKTSKKLLKQDFNGQILNKRLIYLDEVNVTNVDQENKLKDLVNEYIEIEAKGKDAKLVTNHSNVYFSSNNLDSINIPPDDRRFSLIMLTEIPLNKIMDSEEINSLTDEANVFDLARFLWHRPIDKNKMLDVFHSEQVRRIRESQQKEWQDWLLDEYFPDNTNKTILVKDVKEAIGEGMDMKNPPGRPKLEEFAKGKKDIFEVRKAEYKGRRKWCIIIK